ncbi:MAG TPA: glycosyltransferase [Mucilaginibacter sp.]|jgi:glycosyltransferase involved in cell wall biosynthesis|nr:glycosyltransferase [Mucilaginibacter sp.]
MELTINLSYIIATHNRLPFLRITLEKLVNELLPDEEIVVVDGNSTDGSKAYLQKLFDEGKIHRFISEPDKNQAHAWNKAMLMAKGIILKKVIDDDVFYYHAIRKCKDFMLANPLVDVIISNDLGANLYDYKNIQKTTRRPQFEKWKNGIDPSFTFGDVHMLIRRASLAYIGLYNTSFIMMDWEYSLRISYLQACIVYYTGYNALSVAHAQSVSSLKNTAMITEQGKKGAGFYEYKGDRHEISLWSKIKIQAGKWLKSKKESGVIVKDEPAEEMGFIYNYLYDHIAEVNNAQEFTFLEQA